MNAVITGATKGIGLAIAEKFAQNGIHLCICSRSTDDLASISSLFKKKHPGISVHTQSCDVSKKEEVLAFGKFALEVFEGDIDILINNAGIYIGGAIESEEEDALEKMINTNLYSAYNLTRALLPI